LVVRLDSDPTHCRYVRALGQCSIDRRIGNPLEERHERNWSLSTFDFNWKARPTLVSWPRVGSCWKDNIDFGRVIALNAASLVCGFIGNLFLLFNFTRRIRYIVALPATIVLFYLATGLLIGTISSMNLYVPPEEGEVYSQGFWHAIIAACLYLFCSVILMVNMIGYFLGHYPQHFNLTDEQRNLILQTMMFFVWLSGGAGIFARTSEEWQYADALYFCDVTVLTVGFGDYSAPNDVSRGLVLPFAVGGIIILGLMVGSIHTFAGELSKDKVIRKRIETHRQRTVSRAVSSSIELQRNNDAEKKIDWTADHRPQISSPMPSPIEARRPLQSIAFDDTEETALARATTGNIQRGRLHRTFSAMGQPAKTLMRVGSRKPKVILMREEKDRFDAMRAIQRSASNFKKWYALSLSVLAFGLVWCVGAAVFWIAEQSTQHITYFEALYLCYVSLLTIGYGDFSPRSNAGKPFFIVWSLIAVPTMTILVSDMRDTVIASFKRGTFTLADWTVLPKTGIYHSFLQRSPWLGKWIERKVEKKRLAQGFPVGFDENEDTAPSLEELANPENYRDPELTHQLALAIRKTADDLRSHTSRKYSYEEWVEFTRLIRFTSQTSEELAAEEETDGVIEWDWIGDNSPMLSEQSEAEWVLDRLCESLMRLLKKDNLVRITAAITSAESRRNSRAGPAVARSSVSPAPPSRRSTSRMRSSDQPRPRRSLAGHTDSVATETSPLPEAR
jgi:potassium channel subfamily K, other eukaryote